MNREHQEELERLVRGRVLFDAPMRRFTSMKVGGPADSLIFPEDADELKRVVLSARKRKVPVFILGKGTDVVVGDRGIRGWVISLTRGFMKVRCDGETIESEAGTTLSKLVRFSVHRGLTGLEPFLGIPGTVGGGLATNAGAWGAEMKDMVLSVSFMQGDGKIVERSRSRLKFSYRNLALPPSWIILKARFQLKKGKKEEILNRVRSYSEMRRKTQPIDYPSAGSIFKNPKEGPAGKWIEEAGLKGLRIGQAMVSDLHANFIINLGKASAREVVGLMEEVERRVLEAKGISLEREVRVVGE